LERALLIVRDVIKYKHNLSPETDGQTEVLKRILEIYLRCFSLEQPKAWVQFISWDEYWYTTFEVVYGKPSPSIARYIVGETVVETVAQDLVNWDEALKQLKFHLQQAQDHISKFANRHKTVNN